MDNLCKIAFSIQEYFELFDFYAKNFGIDDNAFFALKQSFILYNEVINRFMTLLKEIRLSDFKAGKYFRDRFFDYGESDVEKLSKLLLKQHDDFEKVGIRLNGDKVSVNLSPKYVKAAKWHE